MAVVRAVAGHTHIRRRVWSRAQLSEPRGRLDHGVGRGTFASRMEVTRGGSKRLGPGGTFRAQAKRVGLRLNRASASQTHKTRRLYQDLEVEAHRCYQVSVWLKTEGLTPARSVDIRVRGKLPFAKPRGRRRGNSWQVTCAGAWRWCNMSAPGAEVIVWHGMFDPNHNAHEDYYLVDRPLTGSRRGSTGTSSSAPSTTTSARRA